MDEKRVLELLAERARRIAATPAQREADFTALERERARGRRLRLVGAGALAAAALLVAALAWNTFALRREPPLAATVALLDAGGRELAGGVRGAGAPLPAPESVLVEVELERAGWALAILVDAAGGAHARPREGPLALEPGRAGWVAFEVGLFALDGGAGRCDWIVLAAGDEAALAGVRLPDAPLPRAGDARDAALAALARALERKTGASATLRGLELEAPR